MKLRLKLFKGDKMVYSTHSKFKRRILYKIEGLRAKNEDWDRAYLQVVYKKDFHNDGEYTSYEDLIMAYKSFTEKDLADSFK